MRSGRRLLSAVAVAVAIGAALPAVASAYQDNYGDYNICGNNCYIETHAAHTFYVNTGHSVGMATYLACQLFQKAGSVNVVRHGYHDCLVDYYGGQYVWGRVYNQTGFTDRVAGSAIY